MRSTTRARLAMCRGELSDAIRLAQSVQAAFNAADEVMRGAGYRPPDEDDAPSMAEVTPKPRPAPAGATAQEKHMAKVPPGAVARQVTPQFGQADLGVAVRDVAREAARQWGHENATKFTDSPEQFGKKVAEVYLAAVSDLSAGFESDPESLGATA